MSSQIDEKFTSASRRNMLMAGAGAVAAATFSTLSHAGGSAPKKAPALTPCIQDHTP
jgi:hypothetical protein